ncbi:hypothetical protein RhiirA4_462349, partial [Rhizophagus irregularis]
EEPHESHSCENKTCPIQCPIPNCKERCQSDDHFHAFTDLIVYHFCVNEHQCRELCEDDGICQIVTEPKKQEETYKGLVKEASITFTKYIQLSERLKCNKKIPPNEFTHTGKHTHKENGFHYCNAKCQFCEYYCTLPYGHVQQTHDTRHGNITRIEFSGKEYAGHILKVGDQGAFVPCNLASLGRHRHIDYCRNEENCKLGNQGQDIQHINEKVQPNPEKPKDFISHKLFWERTGFKDPYTVREQQEFTKCDHECPDEKHHKSQGSSAPPPTKSFCELQLFHAPLSPSSNPPNGYGYISLDGHHFNCENPTSYRLATKCQDLRSNEFNELQLIYKYIIQPTKINDNDNNNKMEINDEVKINNNEIINDNEMEINEIYDEVEINDNKVEINDDEIIKGLPDNQLKSAVHLLSTTFYTAFSSSFRCDILKGQMRGGSRFKLINSGTLSQYKRKKSVKNSNISKVSAAARKPLLTDSQSLKASTQAIIMKNKHHYTTNFINMVTSRWLYELICAEQYLELRDIHIQFIEWFLSRLKA